MREFKFIRGKYTDENIFNSDETNNCLFAYDSEGGPVEFTEKNNKEFQDKFVELSSAARLSEIYTFRPSQFTISAEQKSDDSYGFTFEANKKVYDGSREFPANVIQKAEELIKAQTTGVFDTETRLPILNLNGAAEQKTPTTFTFKDKPSFTRNLVFKVSGSLNERGYATAQGESIDAYKTASGKIDYSSGITKGTFYGGRKQQLVEPVAKTVVSAGKVVSEDDDTLTVASNYTPADGYRFIYNKDGGKQFSDEIKYGESSAFDLYKQLSEYLETSNANDAVTISKTFANTTSTKYTLNNNEFVSYSASPVEGTTYYEEDTSSSNTSPIYASKVNNAPKAILDTEAITFVSGDAIKVSPVDKLIAANAIFYTIPVEDNQLAYAKINNAWTSIPEGQHIDVKFFVRGYTNNISSFTKGTIADHYTVDVDGGQVSNIPKDDISCTMTYGTDIVSEFKYFDTLSQNKYIVKASVSEYLNSKAADDFVKMKVSVINTSYNLKNGYVAYKTNISLSTVYNNNLNAFYEYDVAKSETSIVSASYNFYHKVQENAYIFKKSFTVPSYGANTIVKGYDNSYSGLFIREGNQLRGLLEADLTGDSISVYTSGNYHLFDGGAYEDSSDTTNYVMFTKDWQSVAISSSNASVRDTDNAISPVITNDTFRLITKVEVNATQSD